MLPDYVFDFVVGQLEGGDRIHDRGAADPGGLTKWGVSKRAHPNLDIANLTREDAMRVYTADYWNRMKCDLIASPAVQLAVFDCAVNQGPVAAAKLMQSAAGVSADGVIGPVTIKALNETPPYRFLLRFMKLRASRYLSLDNSVEEANERGWMNRLIEVLVRCFTLDLHAPEAP